MVRIPIPAIPLRMANLAVFGLAMALGMAIWLGLLRGMPMLSDAADYLAEAAALAVRFPAFFPDAGFYWPPGTAMVLAGTCGAANVSLGCGRLVTLAVSAGSVLLVRLLARTVARDEATVAISTALALLYPPALLMAGQSFSQVYAQFWLLLFCIALLRGWRARDVRLLAVSGLALGLACLTRPSVMSLWLVVAGAALWLAWHRPARPAATFAVRGALVFAIAFAAIVAPVMAGHYHLLGAMTLSTNNERNFFLGNNRYTPDYKTSHLAQRPLAQLDPEIRDYLREVYSRPDRRAAMMEEAREYIRANPGRTAWRTANRIRAFWGFDYMMSRQIARELHLGKGAEMALLAVEAGGYLLLILAVVVGLFHGWPHLHPQAWLLVALAVAYQVPYAIAFSGGTYHFPVMGLLVPVAAAGVAFVARHRTPLAISGWAFACMALLCALQVEYGYHLLALADP